MYKVDDKIWYFLSSRGEYFPGVILECYDNDKFDIKYYTLNSWHTVKAVDIDNISIRNHIERVEMITEDDKVNSPKHYNAGSIEVIDFIESHNFNFCLGNAIKYISRCNHKDNKEQDLKKAIWYIEREIKGIK